MDDPRPKVPAGQHVSKGFPVLHVGPVPAFDPRTWRLRVDGAVEAPLELDYAALRALPETRRTADLHCVTTWSILDRRWSGYAFAAHGEGGYTTNIPLADLMRPEVLLCWGYEGEDLTAEHGAPLRLLVPHLCAWKSCKWLNRLEFCVGDRPGFWEVRGYHMRGDPWQEQRFEGDP